MNILGRVLGGILIFVSLGWFASIAGLLPFGRNTNQQIGTNQTTSNQPAATGVSTFQAQPKTATGQAAPTTAQGTTAQGTTQTAPAKPEANPRDAGASDLTTTPAAPKPAAPAQPQPAAVPAGW